MVDKTHNQTDIPHEYLELIQTCQYAFYKIGKHTHANR